MRDLFLILFIFYCFFSSIAQTKKDTTLLGKQLDSLLQLDYNAYSIEDYQLYQDIFSNSKKIHYKRGVLTSLLSIIWYQSNQKSIDSVLYYSEQFEKYEAILPDHNLYLDYLINNGNLFLYAYGLPELALPYFIKAYEKIDKDDVGEKADLTTKIADCYIQKGQYDLAISEVKNILADTIYLDFRFKLKINATLAMAYQHKKQPKLSTPLLADILNIATKNGDSAYYTYAKLYQAYDYYLNEQYQKAIDSLHANYKLLQHYFQPGVPTHHEFLSNAYGKLKNYTHAAQSMQRAIKQERLLNDLPKYYTDLATYYQKLGKKDSVWLALQQKNEIVDSIRQLEKKVFTDYYDTRIELIEESHEKVKIEASQSQLYSKNTAQKQYIIILIISILLLTVVVVALMLYKKYDQSKEKINLLEENEKKLLKQHIKTKEDELSATLMIQAKQIQKLKAAKKELYTNIETNNPEQLKKSKKSFDKLIKNMTCEDVFSDRLESQYPGLVLELKEYCPELSKNNIRHCLLVKLGLSLKESANLLNVATNTVKTARYRAKLKLGLPEEVSLEEFLKKIESKEPRSL
ncbi:tetratricopeptide repeat protein [Aquimarina algicola]|uniref:HTH luxR-type domain-containing protein n=1 Tax=Aquimarina algicola TaxID=2589995 RepID=A0A504J995_9FLAO|nr:hypothetical protein [Aquimarina algicola]TPN84448.1 hypothetical protein FHK87_16070 [Aquimarina algicola]